MSKDAVTKLLQRANEGSELRKELDSCLQGSEGNAEAFMAVAARHGYEFSPQEFAEAVAEASSPPAEGELSDGDLEGVAGGIILHVPRPNLSWGHQLSQQLNFDQLGPNLQMGGPGGWAP